MPTVAEINGGLHYIFISNPEENEKTIRAFLKEAGNLNHYGVQPTYALEQVGRDVLLLG